MNLNFTLQEGKYVSEFQITKDFNLHIELPYSAPMFIYQRTAGTEYEKINAFESDIQKIVDVDMCALVYPKYLKIVSEVEPTYAEVISDGEITEIKSQSKEVEIVANGTTDITPDAGYSYLSDVTVKVNVPQEGETQELKRNDVNFFDYDGALLYSYSWEEARNLTELPAAPSHDGMTFKEWNYTLEDIKEQGTDTIKGKADVGTVFVDGSGTQVESPNDVWIFIRGTETIEKNNEYGFLNVVSIPNTVHTLEQSSFAAKTITSLVLPKSVVKTDKGYGSIIGCTLFDFWRNGEGHTWNTDIHYCVFPSRYRIPESYSRLAIVSPTEAKVSELVIPNSVSSIGEIEIRSEFFVLPSVFVLDFSECDSVVSLETPISDDEPCIIVPDALYDNWCAATNWSSMNQERIFKVSEFVYFSKRR